ncbi:MAG: hypothetical protein ACWGSQ_13725, partial [Longimicrobiales bacterium]
MPSATVFRWSNHSKAGRLPLKAPAPGWTLLLLFLTLISAAACDVLGPETPDFGQPQPGDLKVLFIGSSYLAVNDLPGIFAGMAEAAGKQVFLARRVQ